MKNKNVWQAVKFTLFSASAGLIQLISFALLHDVFKIPDYNACYLPSLILSVLWNFTFNRRYTFRSDGNVKRAMLLVALYYVVFITLSRWWSTELVAVGVHDWLIEVINMLVNFVTEFLFQKFVVYRGTIDTNELKSSTCRKCSSCACPVRATRTRRAARISRRSACCTRSATH